MTFQQSEAELVCLIKLEFFAITLASFDLSLFCRLYAHDKSFQKDCGVVAEQTVLGRTSFIGELEYVDLPALCLTVCWKKTKISEKRIKITCIFGFSHDKYDKYRKKDRSE